MKRTALIILVGWVVGLAGCKSEKPDGGENEKDQKADAAQSDDQLTVVAPAGQTGERSPAKSSASEELTVDSPPKMICEKFLTAIRKGDNLGWERLLTRSANNLIRTARVEMQYPGGERATCSVAETQYNSIKKDVALVRCFVQEPVGGKMETFEFSYLLRKQSNGWRIAGIWIDVDDEGNRDYLSFENSDDVARIKSMDGSGTAVASGDKQTQLK